MSTLLKRFPRIVQSTNHSLQNLKMHLTQMRKSLLNLGQVVLLTVIRRKRLIGGDNVYLLQQASVCQTLTRSNPVFEFTQSVVVHASARLKPIQQSSLLYGIWIDPVGKIHCQQCHSLPQAIAKGKCLSHLHRWKSTSAGSLYIPALTLMPMTG